MLRATPAFGRHEGAHVQKVEEVALVAEAWAPLNGAQDLRLHGEIVADVAVVRPGGLGASGRAEVRVFALGARLHLCLPHAAVLAAHDGLQPRTGG